MQPQNELYMNIRLQPSSDSVFITLEQSSKWVYFELPWTPLMMTLFIAAN